MNNLAKENVNKLKKTIIVGKKVRQLGIPIHVIGYKYIVEALTYMLSGENMNFVGDVYKTLSCKHSTSYECVEAAIRNAIQKAALKNERMIRKSLKIPSEVKLSNSVFLNAVKMAILEESLSM